MRTPRRPVLLFIGLMILFTVTAHHAAAAPPDIPPPLAPWVDWVLHDNDTRACPLAVNSDERQCRWNGALQLWLNHNGGRFSHTWQLYPAPEREQWVTLPGDDVHWPQQVQVDDVPAVVLRRDGRPMVKLTSGSHQISGQFHWSRLPDDLALPPDVAQVTLSLNGDTIAQPTITPDHRLLLHPTPAATASPEPQTVELHVTRLISDGVPVTVTTRLALNIAGSARQITLGPVTLGTGVGVQLDSPLPAQWQPDNRLRIQAQPGQWVLELTSRHAGTLPDLTRPPAAAPWPATEVWAVRTDAALRQVTLHGAEVVDPRQTHLPPAWQQLPAYLIRSDSQPTLAELPQLPSQPDQLALARQLWLDFDGGGVSVRDRLSGTVEQAQHLTTSPPFTLGQVRVNGEARLITRLDADKTTGKAGVEIRPGPLELTADGRLDVTRDLPISAWSTAISRINTTLHLPPGWDLLAVNGTDNVPNSWLARWSLLDIFLVLIAATATARLFGNRWGALALVALILTWQAPNAPQLVWLHLLAAIALRRHLPATAPVITTLRRGVTSYYWLTVAALVLITLPFLLHQLRTGVYPQLTTTAPLPLVPAGGMATVVRSPPPPPMAADALTLNEQELAMSAPAAEAPRPAAPQARKALGLYGSSDSDAGSDQPRRALPDIDPNAQVQTGMGVPNWTWHQFTLNWNAPVTATQTVQLWLLPPAGNLALALAQVALLLGLIWKTVVSCHLAARRIAINRATPAVILALGLSGVALSLVPPASHAAEVVTFPPPELLEQLQTRLLAPPDCLPECVTLAHLHIKADAAAVQLRLTLDAAVASAVPLPVQASSWNAAEILLNDQPVKATYRNAAGQLLLAVPAGHQQVTMTKFGEKSPFAEKKSPPAPPLSAEEIPPSPPLSKGGEDSYPPLQKGGRGDFLPATSDRGDFLPLDLPLPLAPRRVTADLADGWTLDGVTADGIAGEQLRLVPRQPAQPTATDAAVTNDLPPLLRVERSLQLGLDWQVLTRVTRLSPATTAVSAWLDLLPDEAVTTPGLQVEPLAADAQRRRVLVSLPPGRMTQAWESRLPIQPQMQLTAGDDERFSTHWCVNVSPLWHVERRGLPPNHPHCASGELGWRLRTGQQVQLDITRPQAVPGATVTLDHSHYQLTPGQRATAAELELTVRSSRGGQLPLHLPTGAEQLNLRIDNQPFGLNLTTTELKTGMMLNIPLVPGTQQIHLQWRQAAGLTVNYQPPLVDVGLISVNANTTVSLPPARWVLWVQGDGIGPAVLFWSVLPLLVILAWAFGRSQFTPLTPWDWLLLGLGMITPGGIIAVIIMAVWLLALGKKRQLTADHSRWRFNLIQVGLILLTIAALSAVMTMVQQGLLNYPAMYIRGNGSSAHELHWYLDRAAPVLGDVSIISFPILVYRGLMLLWALWLAWRLLTWLRWGWQCFATPVPWRGKTLTVDLE
ncbi:hypothetical protein [Thiospirillum jenense]|uniref:Uncharacterized protein n=1 Tax=Thiospirillum jenense TaxID=1653858 RepID=A0A839HI93_9GAMM|nr:hypothetical protein [Thiospirillum jenense]MBB1126668.1 hypothetical protein [Thiospirillum jenense]